MNRPGHIQIIAPEQGGKAVQSNEASQNLAYGFLGSNRWMSASFRECDLGTAQAVDAYWGAIL